MTHNYPDDKLESIYNYGGSWRDILRKAYNLGRKDKGKSKKCKVKMTKQRISEVQA